MGLEHGQDCLGSVVVPVRFVREGWMFVLSTRLAPATAGAERNRLAVGGYHRGMRGTPQSLRALWF